jgi:[NiFe] hydrogenase assembly HybE family chaperone
MTEAALAPRPSPAAALQARFESIWRDAMADVPMVNPALAVQALGFRPWGDHWLGALVTPWFMNLVLLPRLPERWAPIAERESRHYVFPAGIFEFIGSRDEVLGDYQACSLFSPMFEFADQASAVATALAALDALFDARHHAVADVPPAVAAAPTASPETRTLSKRGFLFGTPSPPGGSGG